MPMNLHNNVGRGFLSERIEFEWKRENALSLVTAHKVKSLDFQSQNLLIHKLSEKYSYFKGIPAPPHSNRDDLNSHVKNYFAVENLSIKKPCNVLNIHENINS